MMLKRRMHAHLQTSNQLHIEVVPLVMTAAWPGHFAAEEQPVPCNHKAGFCHVCPDFICIFGQLCEFVKLEGGQEGRVPHCWVKQ